MLEQEFKEKHDPSYKADWLLEENQIKGKEDDQIKRNKDKIIKTLESSTDLKYSEIKEKLYVYDLCFRPSVTTVADLVNEDRNLVIIALVGNDENLHIRIFDANGKRVVDKAEYDLCLMSVDIADGLMKEGRNLLIVALVGEDDNFHIGIFDSYGNIVVDKAEKDLTSREKLEKLEKLKEQCKSLLKSGNKPALSPEVKRQIIQDATSIAGHTLELMSGETLEKLRRQCSSLNEAALSPEVKRQIIQDATSIARHGLTTENLCPNLTKLLQQCSKNRSLLYNFKHLPSEELLSREDMQLREMAKYLEENRESTSEKLGNYLPRAV